MTRLLTGTTVIGLIVLATLTGGVVTLSMALVVTAPWILLTAGGMTSATAWAVVVWWYGGRKQRPRRWVLAIIGVVASAVVLASVLVPVDDPTPSQPPVPGAGAWTLTDGTRLSYGVEHAARPSAPPVVVVHGGPGVPDLAGDLDALSGLTADGHDVYAYAQVGSGKSSRLRHPGDYTVQRAIDDLDQVRARLGANKMILVGHSYGAFLAAAYLATYPTHVARVVFTSPGSLRNGLTGSALQTALGWRQRLITYRLLARPRLLLAYGLLQVNPDSAHTFAGDHEMDARQERVTAATNPALHCPGTTGPVPPGSGFYANQTPQSWRAAAVPDIRGRLHIARIPALVLKGQCDYVNWATGRAYLAALPDAELAYVHGAGHDIKDDSPKAYLDTIRAFLQGRPVPHLLTSTTTPPADYQPDR